MIRQRRQRRIILRARQRRGWRRAGLAALALLAAFIALILIGAGWAYIEVARDLPAIDNLATLLDPQNGALRQPTRLYDRSGQHLIYTFENPGIPRRTLPIDPARSESISPALIQSVLVLQDPDFLTRPNLRLTDLGNPQPVTIAEKLVDEFLLAGESPGPLKTLRQRLLADQALTRYGRLQILEWYLNNASFGHLAYGADAAAQLYFGKPASSLDWAESALLAAVLGTPALNPLDAPAAAIERQREVLAAIYQAGVIDKDTFTAAANTPLAIRSAPALPDSPARAFSLLVLEQLASSIGSQRLERGGLTVFTSLDFDLQSQLNCTLRAQLGRLNAGGVLPVDEGCPASQLLPASPISAAVAVPSPPLAASALILDPTSGQVLALAGDTTLQSGEGAVLEPHPAGSLPAPFLALSGFARSLSPSSLVWDIPTSLEGYNNPDGGFLGPISLRGALVNNRLVPLTQLLLQVGPVNFIGTAHSLGWTSLELPADERDTFFTGEPADPLEAGFAYSAFANLGLLNGHSDSQGGRIEPVLALRVEDSAGDILFSNEVSTSQPAVSAQLAYLVHDTLSDEPARWPSLGFPNPLELDRPAGAFAARTVDGSSTWTVGYTPQRLALVWLGAQDGASVQGLDPRLAAGIWHALIQYASRDQPITRWSMPAGLARLEICSPSGLLPTAQCPSVVSEVFLEGSQPVSSDTLYRRYQINRETGRLATVFTPPELVEDRTYLVVPPEAQEWARQAGLPIPPLDYDAIQTPPINPNAKITSPAQFSAVSGRISLRGSASGAEFLSYRLQVGQGINPTSWVSIVDSQSAPVENGLLAVWDTGGLEGLYAVRLLVVHEGQRIETAVLQVTVDNTAPAVSLPYPEPGQVFNRSQQQSIVLQAEVEDAVGIQRVEWWLDGRKLGERISQPYALVWDLVPGEHTLQLRSVDTAGNQARSEEITFTVK